MTLVRRTGQLEHQGVEQLFPDGTRRLSRRPQARGSLLVLPSRRSPRLLVPDDVPAAHDMLRRHSSGRRQRLGQRAMSLGLRSGLLQALPLSRLVAVPGSAEPTIEDHVRQHVPGAARVGVLLGPPRANGKPVLRVFDADGRTLAYGKVAHDELSSALVVNEAVVLRELSERSFQHVATPRVLHSGHWNGRAVLYQSALTVPRRRTPDWSLPLSAVHEIAESEGLRRACAGGSPYAISLAARVRELRTCAWLESALEAVLAQYGDVELQFGRWHGDWAPWNTGVAAGHQQVWDWERSRTGVPVGLDVLHWQAQRALAPRSGQVQLEPWLFEQARRGLVRWSSDARVLRLTLLLYAVEILHRYLADAHGDPTPALRRRISMLRALLPDDSSKGR